jgi:hypothetical protein
MRGFCLLIVAALIISGCGIVRSNRISDMSPTQVRSVATGDLCNKLVDGTTAVAERQRRGLSDCSYEDQQCVKAGFASGTPQYDTCRANFRRQEFMASCASAVASYCPANGAIIPQFIAAQARQTVSMCMQQGYYVPPQAMVCAAQQPPPVMMAPPMQMPTTTNCSRYGNNVSCTTQ